MLTGLPSITALGMAALLPDAERQQVSWDGDWKITLDQQGSNLAEKAGRLALLEQRLPGMQHMNLADLTRARTRLSATAPWLIVFSTWKVRPCACAISRLISSMCPFN